jgi:hypothetical protein
MARLCRKRPTPAMLLKLLNKRFTVSDDARKRVETCTDEALLGTWFERALTVETLGEVFAD